MAHTFRLWTKSMWSCKRGRLQIPRWWILERIQFNMFTETNISPFKGTFEDDFPIPQVGNVIVPWRLHTFQTFQSSTRPSLTSRALSFSCSRSISSQVWQFAGLSKKPGLLGFWILGISIIIDSCTFISWSKCETGQMTSWLARFLGHGATPASFTQLNSIKQGVQFMTPT